MSSAHTARPRPRTLEELGEPYQAGDQVGLTGLEARFEKQLAGTPSGDIMAVAAGDQVEVIDHIAGREPEPVKTTLDPAVQAAVEVALGDTTQPTAVVVVDSHSNVRAVASRPSASSTGRWRASTRRARRSRW